MELSGKQKKKINEIAEKYNLKLLFLFGSQVTGQTHAESDYDIGYLSERELTLNEEGELIIALMPIIEVRDERLINLVSLKKASPLLLYAATKSAQVLYEKRKTAFAELQALAFKKYIEMMPLYKLKRERMFSK